MVEVIRNLTIYYFRGLEKFIRMYVTGLWQENQSDPNHNQEEIGHQAEVLIMNPFYILYQLHFS